MAGTLQSQAIMEVLERAERPLTRDEILSEGRRIVERLGPATVDRHIRELSESFQLVGVEFPGQPRRFELPAESEHPHFICRKCERVFDLPIKMQLPEINPPKGFKVSGGEIIYSGTCPDCV